VRWWNVKHPSAYAGRLTAGVTPAQGREILDDAEREQERVLLGIRLASGLPIEQVPVQEAVPDLVAGGLAEPDAAAAGRVLLTRRGRLLADGVVRRLLG
jgi:coproporphyrinogen III oxidase-like Fe-S oxidoreductase